MNPTEVKPLRPLDSGNVLIVGSKTNNFNESIRTHPRIIMWEDDDNRHLTKRLPVNTRAVFMTRFVGHDTFRNILSKARKKHITVFNSMGSGMIVKSIKELLSMNTEVETKTEIATKELDVTPKRRVWNSGTGKLKPLISIIDFEKSNIANARILLEHAERMNIQTTVASLANFVTVQRRAQGLPALRKPQSPRKPQAKVVQVDTSVEILDRLIQDMKDLREFFVTTTRENASLKARLDKFRKFLEGEV